MNKHPSRSSRLIAAMHHAALTALAASPTGQLREDHIMQAIGADVAVAVWVSRNSQVKIF
jgi:hypothetical protein